MHPHVFKVAYILLDLGGEELSLNKIQGHVMTISLYMKKSTQFSWSRFIVWFLNSLSETLFHFAQIGFGYDFLVHIVCAPILLHNNRGIVGNFVQELAVLMRTHATCGKEFHFGHFMECVRGTVGLLLLFVSSFSHHSGGNVLFVARNYF